MIATLVVAALLSQYSAPGPSWKWDNAAPTLPPFDALHVECSVRSPLASQLATRSQLVLHSGDQGAYSATQAVLVGTPKTGEAPAVLKGFAAPSAEGFEIDRPRVTLLLMDAVKVELWGDPLVARYVETPSGRFETNWEEVRRLDRLDRDGKNLVAETPELRLWRDDARIGLTLGGEREPRTGTDYLRALEVAGTWGLVRKIVVNRDGLRGLESVTTAPNPSSPLGRPIDSSSTYEQVLCERGTYWDVCRFAVTYVVLKKHLADGSTHWWLRYGQLPHDQQIDCQNAIDLVEASFLAGRDSQLTIGELLAAVVVNDVDRRALLQTHAPEVYKRNYGERVQDTNQARHATLSRPVDVAIAAAAPVVVVAFGDNSLRVLDANDGAVRATWAPPAELMFQPWAVALDPAGDTVAVFTRDAAVHLWRWREAGPLRRVDPLPSNGEAAKRNKYPYDDGPFLEWSPKGDRLLAGLGTGSAVLLDGTGQRIGVVDGLRGEWFFAPLCWDATGARFAAGLAEGAVLFNAVQGRRLETQLKHGPELSPGQVQSLAFSPDGKRLAVGLDERRIRSFDLETGRCVWTTEIPELWFIGEPTMVGAVAFSPNGKLIAGSSKATIHALLFEAESGKLLWTGKFRGGREGEPAFVEWAPDGASFFLAYASGVMPIGHFKVLPFASDATLQCGSLPEFGWNGLAIHKSEGTVRALAGGSGEVKWTVRY